MAASINFRPRCPVVLIANFQNSKIHKLDK